MFFYDKFSYSLYALTWSGPPTHEKNYSMWLDKGSYLHPCYTGKKVSHFFTFFSFRTRKVKKSGRFYFFSCFKKLEKSTSVLHFSSSQVTFFVQKTQKEHRRQKTQNDDRFNPISSQYSPFYNLF